MSPTRFSIVDLLASGTPVHPHEAAAIVLEVCAQIGRQPARQRTLPLLDALMIEATGSLVAHERRSVPSSDFVPHLGRLLRQLLGNRGFAQAPLSGDRLLGVAARAVDGEQPTIKSVRELGEAIGRLEPAWRRELLRELFQRARQLNEQSRDPIEAAGEQTTAVSPSLIAVPAPSPVRATLESAARPQDARPANAAVLERPKPAAKKKPVTGQRLSLGDLVAARELAGLSLEEIARRTRISTSLLRGLEAGSLKHWPEGVYRRSWLRAYAAEVGLDPEGVLALFTSQLHSEEWPDLAESLRQARELAGTDAARRPLLHRLVGGGSTSLFAFLAMFGRLGPR
jgi:transcriptional regulator with XRE-family HTH domain